ncbi:nucleosome assembly protein 1;2 [Selaginella moellendorffii]|uniref:nucleosome assembly protein 1;2 n=1 Tax=Selaginella moellendorffii TaxID=88036 RepID=UPI000D1CC5AB|nr:nucleosome assembly protein 1;2 [Selaginella moellendorffii]XP_024537745.1 nucleosome assembly protein 1;2 [Selaginella moellendorffii]|eukprot:XP_002980631.2 nucleosome assembly protein 1;2 [Selaginella moellendorffii]
MSNADQPDPAVKAPSARVAEHLASLPEDVKQRVNSLQEIQKEHDEIEAKFKKEREELITKYQNLYAPLYEKRASIVNASSAEETKPDEAASNGVPEFWLGALKANEIVAVQITERDQGALKYLKDIKSYYVSSPKGFKLEFYFDENPYFTNSVLTKEYHMEEDDDEPILERAVGTKIDWKPGKDLTVKLMKKKPKKGAKDTTPQTKLQACETFFNFFNPPEIPENEEEIDPEEAEELQDLMEQDYDVGATIRDKIVPHAVSWFTGEAVESDDEAGDDEDDEDEEDEDEDDEVTDDEEEFDAKEEAKQTVPKE